MKWHPFCLVSITFYKICNIEGNTMSYVARELSQRNKMLFGLGSFLIPIGLTH